MNSSHKVPAFLLATGLTFTAVTAFAQVPPPNPDYVPPPSNAPAGLPRSESSNVDTIGGASLGAGATAAQYKALDADLDGRISLDEFVAPSGIGGKSTATARSGSGGTARSDEATNETKAWNTPALFRQLDKDSDGFLSASEIAVAPAGDTKR